MEMLDGQAKDVIRKGIEHLAGVCDHASSRDLVGFSANTASTGHELARLPDRYWTDGTFVAAARILRHHRQQAIDAGVLDEEFVPSLERIADGPEDDVATAWIMQDDATNGVVLSASKEMADIVRLLRRMPGAKQPAGKGRLWVVDADHAFVLRKHLDRFSVHGDAEKAIAWSAKNARPDIVMLTADRTLDVVPNGVAATFPYAPDVIAMIKNLQGRFYDGKRWVIALSKEAGELMQQLCAEHEFVATSAAQQAIEAAMAMPPTIKRSADRSISAQAIGDRVRIGFKYAPDIVEAVKSIPKEQRWFDSVTKAWSIEATAVTDLVELLEALDVPVAAESLDRLREMAPAVPTPR